MLIAEDLLLLAFDDETGQPARGVTNVEQALAGALLVELAMLGRVAVTEDGAEGESVAPGRLVVRDASPTGQDALDDALRAVEKLAGEKPQRAVTALSGDQLSASLLAGLAERGILRRERGKVLGIFPTTRWPAEDSRHEDEVRAGLHRVLAEAGQPTEREVALISLLSGLNLVRTVVETDDPDAAERRAKEIAEGNWVGEAMGKVVEEMMAAVMVTLFVPMFMATMSS